MRIKLLSSYMMRKNKDKLFYKREIDKYYRLG